MGAKQGETPLLSIVIPAQAGIQLARGGLVAKDGSAVFGENPATSTLDSGLRRNDEQKNARLPEEPHGLPLSFQASEFAHPPTLQGTA